MYIGIAFAASVAFAEHLKRENARRERGERDEIIEGIDNKLADERNGRYPSKEAARLHKGD